MDKQTKIIATISDLRCEVDFIRSVFNEGMNVARMNSAHLNAEGFTKIITNIRTVSKEIGILMDTKGPEVRTTATQEPIKIKTGDKIKITGNSEVESTHEIIAVSYKNFVQDISVGSSILFDDGEDRKSVV